VERRNKLDNLCYSLEKTLYENTGKLQAADVGSAESLIREGREAIEAQNHDLVTSLCERLESAARGVANALSQGSAAAPADGPPPVEADRTGKRGGTDIADAEFEETHVSP
jgi:molecular chaperone DnaK